MKNKIKSNVSDLRQKAEELIKLKSYKTDPKLSEADNQKLIYDLEVHQVELELQNEELKLAQEQLNIAVDNYSELYDFAPMGYFTLSKNGEIVDVNLFGAEMLGGDRSRIKESRFGFFVSIDTRPVFNLFLENVLAERTLKTCEVSLSIKGNLPTTVQLTGIASDNGLQCLVTAVDITEIKNVASINEMLLASLPHPAMYIRRDDKIVIAANKIAIDLGVKVGTHCWRHFMKSEHLSKANKELVSKYPDEVPADLGIKCVFCMSEKCFTEAPEQNNPEVKAFGLIWDTYWNKITDNVYLHYAINVTEKKRVENIVKESLDRFQNLADLIRGNVAYVNIKTLRYEFVNLQFGKSFALPREKIVGKHIREIIGEENFLAALPYIEEVREGKSVTYENIFNLAKGERWVEVHYSPVFDEKGQVESIVVLSNDISERRKAEQDLLLSELKFRTVADHTFDWEYWLGVNKRLVYMSPSCLRISGYSVEEFFADDQLLLKIVHPADSKIWKDHLDKVNAEDHPGNADELEYRIIKKDGSVAYIGHICTPVFDQKGYFIGRRVSNRGITNRKLAEQNLAKQTEELRLMNTYFVDREIKMIELKKEINRLLNAAGQAEKYEIFE